MIRLPVRWRVALWSAVATAAALLVFAAGTLINLFQEQIEEVDLKLAGAARRLTDEVNEERDRTVVEEASHVEYEPWLAAAVFSPDGRLLVDSARIPEAVARSALRLKTPTTVHAAQGEWRVLTLQDVETTVILAYNLEEVDEIVDDLLAGYMIALPLAAGMAAFGGWLVAGRALQPVRDATVAAARITPDRMEQRLPVPPVRDEIAHLTRVINAMLDQMEASFRQAERFAADASHEIRTPLTIIKGEIEAALRTPELSAAVQTRLLSVQEEIVRLQRVAEQLLLLARLDAGSVTPPADRVDFSALVREACEDAELMATAHQVRVVATIAERVHVTGDEDLLRRVVLNLLENACKFNEARGRVQCTLEDVREQAVLTITNTGPGIAPAIQPRLFQRFFRGDEARSRSGHGLGLSLSRELAQAHGGTLDLVRSEPGHTEFRLAIPTAPRPATGAPRNLPG